MCGYIGGVTLRTYCLLLTTNYYSHSKIGKVGCFNECIVEKGKRKKKRCLLCSVVDGRISSHGRCWFVKKVEWDCFGIM